jgi:hypothetical protein
MDTVGERLYKLIDALGVDRVEFGEKTGIRSGTMSQVINGKLWEKKGFPVTKLKAIIKAYPEANININYLKTGIGTPLGGEGQITEAKSLLPAITGLSYIEVASLIAFYKGSADGSPKDNAKKFFDQAEAMDEERLRRAKKS